MYEFTAVRACVRALDGSAHLHDGCPKVHSLDANLTLPHALEPALLGALGGALPSLAALAEAEDVLVEARGAEGLAGGLAGEGGLAEERARGAEEVACRGHPRREEEERHAVSRGFFWRVGQWQ